MTNAFLERTFARYLLPESVYDMALKTYGHRYAHYFNVHPRLGARVACLLGAGALDDEDILIEALGVKNLGALDFTLGRPKLSLRLVEELLNCFHLCENDQERLRSTHLPRAAKLLLISDPQFTADTVPAESYARLPHNYGLINQFHEDQRMREFAKDVTFKYLNPHWTPDSEYIARLSQVLENEMGEGTTPESLECWRYFLALMDQGCDQPVTEIVGVARALSSDTLQTA